MIDGAHVIIYSKDAEADKAFFRNVLKFGNVDVGHGWLIFKLPPSELALHPAEADTPKSSNGSMVGAVLYLMCGDLETVIASLQAKSIAHGPVSKERWGILTTVRLPSGADIGLYQPTHPTAYDLR